MFLEIQYEDIDNSRINGSFKLIDLRSPSEYYSETIPGAINIPIFTDEERKIIGTTYIQESIDKAKKLGIEAVSKKLPQIYEIVSQLDKEYDSLIFFCARGGFRSNTVASLFRSIGINSIRLDGGYKSYRRYINENLPKILETVNFVVLYGNTGSGKTEILKYIKENGHDVLDIEACANHRGSLLGSVGLETPPHTQKMFEGLIYDTLKNRKSNLLFTEGESKRIGRVVMPDYMFDKIKKSKNIYINSPINIRVQNILKEYVHDTDEELIEALNLLRKRLGSKNIDNYIKMINDKKYNEVIEELMIKYYDPLYESKNREYIATFNNLDAKETAEQMINLFK
ncbi:tRNA 2-selenouridine(34) synthase MnmH [Tissierella sp. Yu-01]|uniref:tRNA 2-selenouridine(34) synthase MnmH n=1 Tax=Tissierella sp. Yu-01 TaxID=3035694 RepID=UPI00240E6683|nr:tRNA 2-selenouridine(34) synthase MnmH [Tissierella sp. Yu-01]WFA09370.1 tRNA 2-selenouridine(34) synthase MnmH [Tissierella sp. Yu-01]